MQVIFKYIFFLIRFLKIFYFILGWTLDKDTFKASKVDEIGDISVVFETSKNHTSIFYKGKKKNYFKKFNLTKKKR
jgi:hypothetical protein